MNLFISPDLYTNSSGNTVSINEYKALKSLGEFVTKIGYDDMNPINFALSDTTPFLHDYLALEKLSNIDLSKISIAQLYAGPFGQTIRYLKAKGIKTVNTYAAHDRKESIKEFELLGYDYPYIHIKDDKLWRIYFAGAKEADALITPSNLSKNFLLNEGCTQKIEIIPHGTNIPDKIEPIPNKFNVGYIGGLGPDKGIVYIIKSWSTINYSDGTLILAGRGTEQLSPFINKYATGGKYHLMGYVNTISDFYNNIAIYVQPSISESWGIEVGEAMAHGRPVIVSNGTGAADMVTNGKDGFIVNKRDVKDITNKIQYFKDNPREIEKMGKNARDKSLNYDWTIIRQKYIDLWKSII